VTANGVTALKLSFVVLISFMLLVPLAPADRPAVIPRIGVMDPLGSVIFVESFRDGLRRAGYNEGKNIVIEWRATAETEEELQLLLSDLVRSKVELLVTVGTPATRAALQWTALPIVFTVGDPVLSGFAVSLAKPGGNGTGVSSLGTELSAKRVEVIHQLAPKARRIGYLTNPANSLAKHNLRAIQKAARSFGLQLEIFTASNPQELDNALHILQERPPEALLVAPVAFYVAHSHAIVQAARIARIPTLYPFREYLAAGGLAAYGVDLQRMGGLLASYVDKILRGAKPADLPIEEMPKYDFVIDLRTAKTLGITIPHSILLRADEVIR
jgi:putative ABC transport system substrate-binding protein